MTHNSEKFTVVCPSDDFKGEYSVYRKPESSRACYSNTEKEDIAIESLEPGNTLEATALKYGVSVANVKAWVRNYERDQEIQKRRAENPEKKRILPGKKPFMKVQNGEGPNQKLVHTNLELTQKLREKEDQLAFLNERVAEMEKILEDMAEENYEQQIKDLKERHKREVQELQALLWNQYKELASYRKKYG